MWRKRSSGIIEKIRRRFGVHHVLIVSIAREGPHGTRTPSPWTNFYQKWNTAYNKHCYAYSAGLFPKNVRS